MQVLVRDRKQGKTTELIKWLLRGREQDVYPYWNRVIVCMSQVEVRRVTNEVLRYIQSENWDPCSQMVPHMHREGVTHHDLHVDVITDVRKAVWSLRDLDRNLVGSRSFEYAIDDADNFFRDVGMYRINLRCPPAVIVLTGELVDSLRD